MNEVNDLNTHSTSGKTILWNSVYLWPHKASWWPSSQCHIPCDCNSLVQIQHGTFVVFPPIFRTIFPSLSTVSYQIKEARKIILSKILNKNVLFKICIKKRYLQQLHLWVQSGGQKGRILLWWGITRHKVWQCHAAGEAAFLNGYRRLPVRWSVQRDSSLLR